MKKSVMITRFLVIFLLMLICFNSSAAQSQVVASPLRGMQNAFKTATTPPARSVVIPIGPVTELPGSTLSYSTNPTDPSYIGKSSGLEITIGGIQLDKYTNVWWGPQDLAAVAHSLAGGMAPDRVLTFDPASSNLAGGTAYFLGNSPSVYSIGAVETRFRMLTLNPMVLAADVNIPDASVVLPITGGGLSSQILFQTKFNGVDYASSLDYFNNYAFKSASLSGSVLSSFTDAFWYTAPDVEVASQSFLDTYCLGSYASVQVTASNHGPGEATQISVDISLPAEWEYVSFGSSPCGQPECYNPSTGEWTVGDLLEGHASMLSLRVKLIAPGEASMTATKTQYQVDSLEANDVYIQTLYTNFCSLLPMIIR